MVAGSGYLGGQDSQPGTQACFGSPMHTQTDPSQSSSRQKVVSPDARCGLDPTRKQLVILRLLSEQVAVPLDQLARLLGSTEGATLLHIRKLEAGGCVERGRFLVGQPVWIWLRHRGARLAATGYPLGPPPAAHLLDHRRAVNEVRIHLAQRVPQGRWICEREVRRHRDLNDHIPDAILEVDGERHAIEVELSRKRSWELPQIVAQHSDRYDAVVYFCGPLPRRMLEELHAGGEFPKLVVRDLPSDSVPSKSRPRPSSLRGLPRGRHGLPREFVVRSQRERLIGAARALVAEEGYGKMTIAKVCDRAAVTYRTLYEHFDGLENCLRAASTPAEECTFGRGAEPELPSLEAAEVPCPPRRHKRAIDRKPLGWEARAMGLLAEQGAIPTDQLARFLQRDFELSERAVSELVEAGYVQSRRFFASEPEWVWLSLAWAARTSPRLSEYRIRAGGLARLRAINEIRLHLDSPADDFRWIGWREVLHASSGADRVGLPVSVVEIGEERHAIELVMGSSKSRQLVDAIDHRSARYDAVICFCTRSSRLALERLRAQNYWPKLILRDLPDGDPREAQRQLLTD